MRYNNAMLVSSRRRLLRAGASLVLIVLLGALAWHLDQYRKIPITRAINPIYWVQHLLGEDRYNPKTGLLEHGDPSVPEVALTFDDGPDPRYGPQIAAILVKDHVPATFFLIGVRVKQYPQVARLLARDGFEIGNHTYDHQRLPPLKPHEIAQELRLCDHWIFATTGKHTDLMRPPGVEYNDKVLHVAKALGYTTVSWTVGASDWKPQSSSWVTQRILDRTENGSIILLHQTTADTVSSLPTIIEGLRAQGYRFVTISTMLARLRPGLTGTRTAG